MFNQRLVKRFRVLKLLRNLPLIKGGCYRWYKNLHLINIGFFCLLNVICTFVMAQEPRICSQGVFCQQFLGYVTFHGGTARSVFESLTKAMFALLAERVWCSKSQSSQLNIHFRLSGFQFSLPFTLHQSVTQKFPICHAPLSRSAWRSFGPLKKSRPNHRFYVCNLVPRDV